MKKKIVALCLCIALAVVAIGGATLAYFTDKTDAVTNTFTVGKVKIDLWETENGLTDGTVTKTGRTNIKVAPGTNIDKNPTVKVVANSEDCWLFVKMTVKNWPTANVTYSIANGWSTLSSENGVTILYRTVAKDGNNDQTFGILTNDKIYVDNKLVSSDFVANANGAMQQPSMAFQAFAIQQDNLTDVNDAWTAVQGAYTTVVTGE